MLVGCSGFASATFDLMLLGDNTNVGASRVVRYDPVNRVVLGGFGDGFINSPITDIAVDQATNRAFVLDSTNIIRSFNYNTGAFLDLISIGTSPSGPYSTLDFDAVSNRLFAGVGGGGNTNLNRVVAGDFSTNLGVAPFATGSFSFLAGGTVRRPGGNWVASWSSEGSSNTISVTQFNGSTFVASGVVTSSINANAGNRARSAIFAADGRFMGLRTFGGNTELLTIGTSATGFVGGITTQQVFTGAAANLEMVNGHDELVYMLNGTTITSYHTGYNVIAGTQTLGFASAANIKGMAIVIAPEPGSMIALGAGVLALVKRRKKA